MSSRLPTGSPAADFALRTVEGGRLVRLSDYRGRAPVVLVFGSFSCNVFCGYSDSLELLYQAYREEAQFFHVAVTEAGHHTPGLEFLVEEPAAGPSHHDVRSDQVRRAMALKGFTMPALIDAPDAPVEIGYDAFPLRVVVVDTDGKVALDLGRGISERWDFGTLERWLRRHAGGRRP
jgi:hypothetical protein